MLIIPIKSKNDRDALVIVLGPENVERMQQADPVQIEHYGKTLHNPLIMVACEQPSPEWETVVQSGDISRVLSYLTRGFQFRPDLGDHDRGPESLHQMN